MSDTDNTSLEYDAKGTQPSDTGNTSLEYDNSSISSEYDAKGTQPNNTKGTQPNDTDNTTSENNNETQSNDTDNKTLENENEGDYHTIMHPDPKKGRTANIVLLTIFLLILLPFNIYAVYSTFEKIYNSLVNNSLGKNDDAKIIKEIAAISLGTTMTSSVAVVCFLLLYCIGALINSLRINGQKRKGEHVIFLISCFLIFTISLQNVIPLGTLIYEKKIFFKTNPNPHLEATFACQVINILVTMGIIIAYMIKPNSVLN